MTPQTSLCHDRNSPGPRDIDKLLCVSQQSLAGLHDHLSKLFRLTFVTPFFPYARGHLQSTEPTFQSRKSVAEVGRQDVQSSEVSCDFWQRKLLQRCRNHLSHLEASFVGFALALKIRNCPFQMRNQQDKLRLENERKQIGFSSKCFDIFIVTSCDLHVRLPRQIAHCCCSNESNQSRNHCHSYAGHRYNHCYPIGHTSPVQRQRTKPSIHSDSCTKCSSEATPSTSSLPKSQNGRTAQDGTTFTSTSDHVVGSRKIDQLNSSERAKFVRISLTEVEKPAQVVANHQKIERITSVGGNVCTRPGNGSWGPQPAFNSVGHVVECPTTADQGGKVSSVVIGQIMYALLDLLSARHERSRCLLKSKFEPLAIRNPRCSTIHPTPFDRVLPRAPDHCHSNRQTTHLFQKQSSQDFGSIFSKPDCFPMLLRSDLDSTCGYRCSTLRSFPSEPAHNSGKRSEQTASNRGPSRPVYLARRAQWPALRKTLQQVHSFSLGNEAILP